MVWAFNDNIMMGNTFFRVRCDFIFGSDARGCMVILIGELDNTTVNLTRETDTEMRINVAYSTSCYITVMAFDIEQDGSIGTIAVHGIIVQNHRREVDCLPSPIGTHLTSESHDFTLFCIVS